VLEDPRIAQITPHLRQLCSDAEYKLEAHWADNILRQATHKAGKMNGLFQGRKLSYWKGKR